MNEFIAIIMTLAAVCFLTMLASIVHFGPLDIRSHENTPYCETNTVAGKNFTRCLKAVEVPAPEEKK